jgi:signal peptidase II
LAIALFATFFLDFATKYLALKFLGPNPKQILGSFLQFNLVINHGAAFSIGSNSGRLFAIFAIVFLAVIFYIGRRIDSNKWALSLGVLAGGVAGNLSDRLFRAPGQLNGGVVDWIALPNWPVFNVADICVDFSFAAIAYLIIKKVPLDSKRLKNG